MCRQDVEGFDPGERGAQVTVSARTWTLILITMVAFATNSLLCREALRNTATDAAGFTLVRITSGALALALIEMQRGSGWRTGGNWGSVLALAIYAAAFSFAHRSLTTGTGALLLFEAVQVTMISRGQWVGERFLPAQLVGLFLAIVGLVTLLVPGISAPEPTGAMLMVSAGIAWGFYSLRGRGKSDALRATAGNFVRAVPLAGVIAAAMFAINATLKVDGCGFEYAALSGAIASGLGYALWYRVLTSLPATLAATELLPVSRTLGLGVMMGSEVGYGTTAVHSGVQARSSPASERSRRFDCAGFA